MSIVMRPTLRTNPRTGEQIFEPRINGKATRAKTGIGTATSGLDSMQWSESPQNRAWNDLNDPTKGKPATGAMRTAPAVTPQGQGAPIAPPVAPQAAEPMDPRAMVRPTLPMFDAAQASPIVGTRAAPISIEGFKDGGPVAQNQHFLANEVGPEAFYNLATEQMEPLGNGEPGIYTTNAPGVVVPNSILPDVPKLSIPEFPAIEPSRVAQVQAEPVAAPYTLGQATTPRSMPTAPVAAVQDMRQALPPDLAYGASEGTVILKPNQYTTPGAAQRGEGVTAYTPNPNDPNFAATSQPSAMPAFNRVTNAQVAEYNKALAAHRNNVLENYQKGQGEQRTGQDLKEIFAAPKPMAMEEMKPEWTPALAREYQSHLNTLPGALAHKNAEIAAKEKENKINADIKKARETQASIDERARLQREQAWNLATVRTQESIAKANMTLARNLDADENKKQEKEQADAREMRNTRLLASSFAKDLLADGDIAGHNKMVAMINVIDDPAVLTKAYDSLQKEKADKRKEKIDAAKVDAKTQAKADETAFTSEESANQYLNLSKLRADTTKWEALPQEDRDQITKLLAFHARNAMPAPKQAASTTAAKTPTGSENRLSAFLQ